MRCKSLLLGGAIALTLTGAAFAQAQSSSDQNSPSGAQTDQSAPESSNTAATDSSAPETSSTATHHMRHHMRHHGMHTASMQDASTPAEKRQTNDLNQQQLQMATSVANQPNQASNAQAGGSMSQNATSPASYSQPQGAAPGSEPGNMQSGGQSQPGPSNTSAPATNGAVGAPGNPATPAEQTAPPQNQNPASQPGPSS